MGTVINDTLQEILKGYVAKNLTPDVSEILRLRRFYHKGKNYYDVFVKDARGILHIINQGHKV